MNKKTDMNKKNNLSSKFFATGVKKLAKLSSILMVILLVSGILTQKVFAVLTITASADETSITISGSGLDGISSVDIEIKNLGPGGTLQEYGEEAVVTGGFIFRATGPTIISGANYRYTVTDSGSQVELKTGTVTVPTSGSNNNDPSPTSPTFTVTNSTAGQVTFAGQGLTGISSIDLTITKNTNGQIQSYTSAVSNGSFTGLQALVVAGENYTYLISDSANANILKSGTFTAFSASGTNTGGSSGTNTGGSSGTNTGGSSGTNTGGSSGTNTGGSSGTNTGGGSNNSEPIILENPLDNIDSLPQLIKAILEIVFKIGSWILAIFIIYVGYKFVAARGSDTKLKEAKDALVYTLIGGAILLGAFVIASAIEGTIKALE